MLSQLHQFSETFKTELVDKYPYKASIGGRRLRLLELRKSDPEARKIRAKSLEGYEEFDEMLHYQELLFVLEII